MSVIELLMDVVARALRVFENYEVRLLFAMFVLTLGIEVARGRRWRELGVRSLWTDLLYCAFYLGGFFGLVFSRPLNRALSRFFDRFAPWLHLDLSPFLPELLHIVFFYVVMDMVSYWIHRLQHTSPFLWSFHRMHHSQQRLNVLTNFRFHFMDQIGLALLRFVPLLLVTPRRFWASASLLIFGIELLTHSGFGWSLGPLGRVFVSPRFHEVHHSSDPVHFHHNFGMVFVFWDRLFGSEYRGDVRPTRFGFPGVPESFFRQLGWPFAALASPAAPDAPDDAAKT
jgi:sterol desaturase/sphingolipid hydroxylase (fatty acid hydroxylase superfamily)